MHKLPTEDNFCDKQGKASKGTEWLIAIQLTEEHDSGQKNYFSTS